MCRSPRRIRARQSGCERMSSTASTTPMGVIFERRADIVVALSGIVGATMILVYLAAIGASPQGANDFYRELWPAYQALAAGHVVDFIRTGPPYVGSAVLRAPLAMIPMIWSGSPTQVYFAAALPCVVAAPLLATWLGAQRARPDGSPRRIGPMLLCLLSPVVVLAVYGGHPEEILGGVLCVAGVVLAANGEIEWAAVLIGLAVINKAWALVAVPVALAAMPDRRLRGAAITAVTAGIVLIPVTALRLTGGATDAHGFALGTSIGTIFNPPELLWWFGQQSSIVLHARALIVLSAGLCAFLWWARCARDGPPKDRVADALLLLAMVLLLRCALDPWNNSYYHVPFIFALLAYEVRSDRPPVLALLYSLALVVVMPVKGPAHVSDAFQAALYAALVMPLLAWMAWRLFAPGASAQSDAAQRSVSILRRSPSPGR